MNKSSSVMSNSVTSWTAAHQDPLSTGFLRQEYWSGFPFPSPGNLPKPGIKHGSPTLQVDSLPTEPPGKSFQGSIYVYMLLNLFVFLLIFYYKGVSAKNLEGESLIYTLQWVSHSRTLILDNGHVFVFYIWEKYLGRLNNYRRV